MKYDAHVSQVEISEEFSYFNIICTKIKQNPNALFLYLCVYVFVCVCVRVVCGFIKVNWMLYANGCIIKFSI